MRELPIRQIGEFVENFQPGDVVCLKSGGPDMTVEFVKSESNNVFVTCIWFEERTLYRTSLPVSALTAALWPIAA
jgi:uncharacterized protein YodC (DUF2158 family)